MGQHPIGFPIPADQFDGGSELSAGTTLGGRYSLEELIVNLEAWVQTRGYVDVPGDLPATANDGDMIAVRNPSGPGSPPALYIFNGDTTTWVNLLSTGLPAPHHATHESGPDAIVLSSMLAVPPTYHFVDGSYTGTISNGSYLFPFKTIMAAVNAIAAIGDSAYHIIPIASGIYRENIVLENAGLKYVKLQGDGYVSINPAAGNALQSIANNANLKALLLSDIGFAKPVVIVGTAGSDSFNDVVWERPKFTAGATLSVTCVNNFSMVDPYSEKDIAYVNVNWSYIESGQLQGKFDFTMDDTQPLPLSGKDGTILANGVFQSGNVSYTIGGTATYTVAPQGCRWGSTAALTVPAGVSILAYNTWLRGTHTNNGTITLRNGNVEGYVAGIGTLVFTANTGTQVHFAPVGSVGSWGGPGNPASLSDAVDRVAAALVAHTGIPIP